MGRVWHVSTQPKRLPPRRSWLCKCDDSHSTLIHCPRIQRGVQCARTRAALRPFALSSAANASFAPIAILKRINLLPLTSAAWSGLGPVAWLLVIRIQARTFTVSNDLHGYPK